MIQTSIELLLSNHETARNHQKSSEIKRKSPYPKGPKPIPMTPPICPQHFSFLTSHPHPSTNSPIQGNKQASAPLAFPGLHQTWAAKWRDVSKLIKISKKALVISQETPRSSWWSYLLSRQTHPKPCLPCLYLPQASKRYASKTIQKCSCFTWAFVQVFWAHHFCQSLGSVVPESN